MNVIASSCMDEDDRDHASQVVSQLGTPREKILDIQRRLQRPASRSRQPMHLLKQYESCIQRMSESAGDRKDRNMLKSDGDANKFQNQRWKKLTFADYMDRNILFESSKNQKQLKARQKNLCRMEYPMTTINQQQSSFSFSWPTDDLRLMNTTSSANCSARSPFTAFSGSHQPANNPDDVNSVSYFRDCADDNIDRQDDTESQVTTAVGSFETFDKTVELFHRYNSES